MWCKGMVLCLALGLGLAMGAWADDDFAGVWSVKQDFQGRERLSTLTIGEDGGTWVNRRGVSQLSDLKTTDGKLTFSRTLSRRGEEFTIECEATLVDGKLVGKMVTQMGDREFTAVCLTTNPAFLGEWDIEMDRQGRQLQAKLDISVADGRLAGKWSSERRGDSDLDNVAIKDDALTFSRAVEWQGQEFTIDYEAALVDGKLSGKAVFSMGGDLPFTGTAVTQEAEGEEGGEAAAMVKTMDADGDGKVSEEEVSEELKQYFSMLDADGDGGLDSAEMQTVVDYRRQQ